MSKFALKQKNDVNGKVPVFKIIEDKHCYWDEFCKSIQKEGTWEPQLYALVSQMNDLANLKPLGKKYKDVTPDKELIKEFELKTNDLRAYGIKDEKGNIIILGGKKSTQHEDYKTFRSVKKRYLESKKK
jgi:hypothetical protein